ncbi:type I DNA topoisomerase, partial [Candidatus Roizmanbacteria bacterium CG_4_10_14_0_8_um_filter_33_9]
MTLILVESPTKARTFNRILKDKDFFVFATMGHIRDLPVNEIAVDTDNNFVPHYERMDKKQKIITELIELGKQHNDIILATDLDREGESISYHIAYILGFIKEKWPDFSVVNEGSRTIKRIVFHEITSKALEEALQNKSDLRKDLVKSQQARRILDRLVGYQLSPLLWKKTGKNWLSAGRVQTVGVRLIVEREKERRSFKSDLYYQCVGNFKHKEQSFEAKLIKIGEESVEKTKTIPLYAGDYTYTSSSITDINVNKVQDDFNTDLFVVTKTEEEMVKRYPPPPYTTSLLQQDAFFKLGFSSKMVMRLAQDLYERGLISYHRTDSFNLSTQFVFRAKDYIEKTFGSSYILDKPRGYKNKSRMAQEAHEAIRPTKLLPMEEAIKKTDKRLTINHKRLYKLIFNRAVATQMKEADIKLVKTQIQSEKKYVFESSQQQILFDGFLKLTNPDFVNKNFNVLIIPDRTTVELSELKMISKNTSPPPRYNEATLIRIMEEKGIGRPSTYAPIISLIQEKGYVEKEGRYFIPTLLGEPISDYLSKQFPELFNLEFTSKMEDSLDLIAEGKLQMVSLLSDFYKPFKVQLQKNMSSNDLLAIKEETLEPCPKCG